MKLTSIVLPAFALLLLNVSPIDAQWQKTGAGTIAGQSRGLVVSGQSLFVGTDTGGVYQSMDGGDTWIQDSIGLTYANVGSMGVMGTTLFAGTQYGGIYRSVNGGATWTAANGGIGTPQVRTFSAIDQNLFIGAINDAGIYLSTDTGTSWTAVNHGLTNLKVEAIVRKGSNLFAGTFGSGVFRSASGQTPNWNPASTGLVDSVVFALAVSGQYLFAGCVNQSDPFFISADDATSWSQDSDGFGGGIICFAQSGSALFACGRNGISASTNNGKSWTPENEGIPQFFDFRAMAVLGQELYVAGYEGVWRRPLSEMINGAAVAQDPSIKQSIRSNPNPFSHSTTISFTSLSGYAKVSVVNILGVEVARLFDGQLERGQHQFKWNPVGMTGGLYQCIVQQGGTTEHVPVELLQ